MARTPLTTTGAEVAYQHGVDEVLGLVRDDPSVTAAVLIRPVSVAEIERTAREGLLMPPKSTFFTPKLRTGFVVRELAPPGQAAFEQPDDALDQLLSGSGADARTTLLGEHLCA